MKPLITLFSELPDGVVIKKLSPSVSNPEDTWQLSYKTITITNTEVKPLIENFLEILQNSRTNQWEL